jgi:MFS family permease
MAISINGWARCFISDILLGSIQQHVFSKSCRWENTVRPHTSLLPTSHTDTNSTAAFNIIMWGLVLSCFAAVENYSGALAIRFFLGVFESAVTPGFALFTSQWYTKKEQGARTGIWFSFNGWAQVRISHHSPQTNIRIVDGD